MPTPKTDVEINARCAVLMGWEYRCAGNIPEHFDPTAGYWNDEGTEGRDYVFISRREDYSPATKIEQALELLDKWNENDEKDWGAFHIGLRYDAEMREWFVQSQQDDFGDYLKETKTTSLKDLPRKIVETVLEVEGGR